MYSFLARSSGTIRAGRTRPARSPRSEGMSSLFCGDAVPAVSGHCAHSLGNPLGVVPPQTASTTSRSVLSLLVCPQNFGGLGILLGNELSNAWIL
jgi:ABC-type Co2+ transport system permease subunit